MLMYPLSWFIPIKKTFFYPPFTFFKNPATYLIIPSWNILSPLYDMGVGRKTPSLFRPSFFFPCAVEFLMQFILFRVLYDHVRFSCRIFISVLPQPRSSPTPVACLTFRTPTLLLSVTPHGGVRLFMWLLHAIHAWLPALNVVGPCYYTDVTMRPVACNLKGDLHASLLAFFPPSMVFYPLKSRSSTVTLLKKSDENCFWHACRHSYSIGIIMSAAECVNAFVRKVITRFGRWILRTLPEIPIFLFTKNRFRHGCVMFYTSSVSLPRIRISNARKSQIKFPINLYYQNCESEI